MRTVFVLLFLTHVASTERHSLEYLFTSSDGLQGSPEFAGSLMVDGVQLSYWDSDNKTVKTEDWMREFMRENPNHLRWYSSQCVKNQHDLRSLMVGIRQQLNQSEGVHVLQMRAGCEWDDDTRESACFMNYSYDGEDFMALDTQQLTWRAETSLALTTKLIWDADEPRLENIIHFYMNDCPRRLKKYLPYVRKFIDRTVLISVSLVKKAYSPTVTCLATGFYSDKAALFWRKDGEKLYEGVYPGEILPNNDDTFQMTVDLAVPDLEHWDEYECVFQLDGMEKDIVSRLDEMHIDNSDSNNGLTMPVIIILCLLKMCLIGFLVWRRIRRVTRTSTMTVLLLPESP